MRRYNTIHPLYLSFFSKSLYQDVARNWNGLCLAYLLLLLSICIIPSVMKAQLYLSDFLNNEAPGLIKQMPVITVSKGRVSIDKPVPYIIKNEKSGAPVAIIDTSGRINSFNNSTALLLLTDRELIIRKNSSETRAINFSEIDSFTIDKSLIYRWTDEFEDLFAIILYPLYVSFSFLYHLIEVLVYASIGLVFSRILAIPLCYRTLMRLAVISVTPVIILNALLVLFDINIPYWWFINFAVSLGYLIYAVKVNSGKENTE